MYRCESSRYHEHLHLHLDGERMGLLPGVIGTVFFDGGSRPDGRQAILDCFDRFDALFGSHLRGGKDTDTGKFSKRNAAGVEKIRRAIQDTPSYLSVSVIRSSATDQDTAAEYNVQVLTSMANPEDYVSPQGWTAPKGQESGLLMLKFNVPMALVTTADGLALYEGFLRFVCERLNADGEGRPTCFIGVGIVHTGSKCGQAVARKPDDGRAPRSKWRNWVTRPRGSASMKRDTSVDVHAERTRQAALDLRLVDAPSSILASTRLPESTTVESCVT
ncbi:type VI immunity family protein [Burkholderia ambifaria]|uniref:type VI immunity family protein n=1 Tax=Burkholderia ambifaria TaxID=152480 RepID=UPI00312C8E19